MSKSSPFTYKDGDACPYVDVEPIFQVWKLSICKNFLEIDWFHGDQVPQAIKDGAGDAGEIS